ncbi:FAD-dependent glycerol-3-phosphate dehydrogenase [Theileria orientalis]|uniref:glycerol-3-phosphate dehydrogenase n=1 Tax=Theileria orientalis TaxID=68886 RepID=A0A976M6K8_THEOR|nr:FAD-dependent glycerol-3-phosphate dehydrogenase [Theileria orientalis]
MGFKGFAKVLGASSVALAGTYGFVKIEHEKCSIPKNTKYTVPDRLNTRDEMLSKLKNEKFDVLVIGGGCTGTSVALDLATRGLNCALVEANDFASGASSKSTKLLHGGIRYLESAIYNLDFQELRFVWKALEERAHMLGTLPYANYPIPIVMPIYKVWQLPYFWVNIKVYEMLARFFCCNETRIPSSFFSDKSNALFNFPALRTKGLLGAVVYYDGQHNDSRTNLMMALTSTVNNYVPGQKGSTVCNYVKVKKILRDESTDKVVGALVEDVLTGEEFKVMSEVVVNCTGPFAGEVKKMNDPESQISILYSRGSHLTVPKKYCPTPYGLIIPKTTDGRVLFALPWLNETIIGTTDNRDELHFNPKATKEDIDFITGDASLYMNCSNEQLRSEIKSMWSGLRPLIKGVDDISQTGKLSRGHVIEVDKKGLVNVYGGKWTICRLMAQDCVDDLLKFYKHLKHSYKCRTRNMVLLGTHDKEGNHNIDEIRPKFNQLSFRLMRDYGLSEDTAAHLVESYGYRAEDVCKLSKELNMLTKLHKNYPHLLGEVVYGVRNELACTPVDVLARRTRLAFLDAGAALESLDQVVGVMEKELNWSSTTKKVLRSEAERYFRDMLHVPA